MVKIKGKRNINKKNDILIKYDKNNDGIVSLEEYLAEEISLGPKAKPSRINYNYTLQLGRSSSSSLNVNLNPEGDGAEEAPRIFCKLSYTTLKSAAIV